MTQPATGVGGFADLAKSAALFDLDGYRIRVASVGDLIRMKQAAGRPKDLVEVEILGALHEEIGEPDGQLE